MHHLSDDALTDIECWLDESVLHDLRAMVDELREARRQQRWQPIETAPRDGTEMLGGRLYEGVQKTWFSGRRQRWLYWTANGTDASSWDPTHWMPLPTPPEATP